MKRLIAVLAAVSLVAALFAVPALARTRSVAVRDNVFSPRSLTIKRNDTLVFRWRGDNPHNVVATRGPVRFRSSVKETGTYRKKFTRRGSYRIICTIHQPSMRMTVRVR
jgi:plastocyanin